MAEKHPIFNQGIHRLILFMLILAFVVSCDRQRALISESKSKESARLVQADQPVTPGNFVYIDLGESKQGKLRASINHKSAVILDRGTSSLIGVLIPKSTGPQALIQVFADKDLIVSQSVKVKPAQYVRLMLTIIANQIRLVSATKAVGAPKPRPINSDVREVLILKLYDNNGDLLHQTMMPYPFASGFEIFPGRGSGLARSDSTGELLFSIKIPYFSDQFKLSFEQIRRSRKKETWQIKNTSQIEVEL